MGPTTEKTTLQATTALTSLYTTTSIANAVKVSVKQTTTKSTTQTTKKSVLTYKLYQGKRCPHNDIKGYKNINDVETCINFCSGSIFIFFVKGFLDFFLQKMNRIK